MKHNLEHDDEVAEVLSSLVRSFIIADADAYSGTLVKEIIAIIAERDTLLGPSLGPSQRTPGAANFLHSVRLMAVEKVSLTSNLELCLPTELQVR